MSSLRDVESRRRVSDNGTNRTDSAENRDERESPTPPDGGTSAVLCSHCFFRPSCSVPSLLAASEESVAARYRSRSRNPSLVAAARLGEILAVAANYRNMLPISILHLLKKKNIVPTAHLGWPLGKCTCILLRCIGRTCRTVWAPLLIAAQFSRHNRQGSCIAF